MKERLLTLALAIGAFVAFYAVMGPKPEPPQPQATRPISTEGGPNGYLGMVRWLESERVPVLSLRERFPKLSDVPGLESHTGNLLISAAPYLYPVRDSEILPLHSWVQRGNTLLIVAGLSDTPDWSMEPGGDAPFIERLQEITRMSFEQHADDAEEEGEEDAEKEDAAEPTEAELVAVQTKLPEPLHFEMRPAGTHPLLEGVNKVSATSEYLTSKWDAWTKGMGVLELAHDPESGAPVLWLLPEGNGQIIVSAYGSIFGNKLLGEDDNARLLANIVRWSLRGNGKVIIDDAHQGLVAFYDPDAFFGDSRLHATLWWLLALWLVFVLGSQRLRPSQSSWNPVDITGFVRATGGFMARVMRPATVGQQMIANFFNDARKRHGLPADGSPMWEWLSAQTVVSEQDVERLQALHAKVQRGHRVNLSQLHNLLIRLRAALN
ncbi:hypothetical protein GCM10011487_15560 [Steroidobacter agaridevorans]|uniref:DUF4350 domain-containing protein n=1 Tax=Steroidobacter agaridevorans TaxID=2695856 RepID=A0A829YA05_9GAMM|nr:DUF4350 domain-containing protein [Steroidobacter agaridevorans]GFE79556.1 hypothetical protein GCM10011487_15560 [Steroidobacter agaridevorans]GFE88561.1 hypothetical protein GCM10011488_35150 [Steroidobacter agaridevorans]